MLYKQLAVAFCLLLNLSVTMATGPCFIEKEVHTGPIYIQDAM